MRERLSAARYAFFAGGADDEFTLRRNLHMFDRVQVVRAGSIARSSVDTSATVLGQPMPAPILVGPTSSNQWLHPDGDLEVYRGASAAGVTTIRSNSGRRIDDMVKAANGALWTQFYTQPTTESHHAMIHAIAAGSRAICITIDSPYQPHRERYDRARLLAACPEPAIVTERGVDNPAINGYRLTPRNPHFTWTDIDRIRRYITVPMIIKGVMIREDATAAVEHGADAIVVSNHGGRVQDRVPSTIEVLPEIVAAVHGRIPVLIDSGIRSGADILKALALGASAALIGRPVLWGLGSFGAAGVTRVMELLVDQLRSEMAAAGRDRIGALDHSLVRTDFP